MSSDTGFELDVARTFDYALVPHQSDWATAGVYREGLAFNNPLSARAAAPHAGPMPARWSWIELSSSALVVSAVTPMQDGRIAVRIYEATGQPMARAELRVHARTMAAEEINLLGDSVRVLPCDADTVRFDMRAWEIKTIVLTLAQEG